ncbi:hypothetical protein EBZ39_02120 [bacterium]|nr:hypothetical protein [bacterium]
MPDFGFVGTSYVAPSIYQGDQECINFFAEIDTSKQPGDRGIVALYPTPGLTLRTQLQYGAVRGLHTLSNDQYAIAVSYNKVYKIDSSFTATQIGTLTTTTGYVSISDNMTTQGMVAYIVDGVNRYTWVQSTNSFATLPSSDGPWQGATVVDSVDGYNIYNEPGTFNWACTDLDSRLSTQALYGSANGFPDPIISMIVDRRQVYLLKDVTTEVWTDVGNVIAGITSFPFQRVPGTTAQAGCGAAFSVARFGTSFVMVCKDTRGNSTIEMMSGYEYQKISTHAVEQSLLNQVVSDAVAFTYQIEGHEMYVVTFPSVGEYGLTWVYDLSTKSWHKWLAWDSDLAVYKRHRANCGCFFANRYLVGDYENGKIYSVENEVYTEDGARIRRLRRAPHLTTDLQRQYFDSFQIQFQPGVGLNTGQGQNPQAMLRWSNDGGSTWSNEHWVSIGMMGNYVNRALWRRLGWSRDRIFEVAISDPIKAVVVSAELKASAGDN